MYQTISNYLLRMPMLQTWEEPRRILGQFVSKRPRDWKLPLMACDTVCGSAQPGVSVAAALACAQIGILLVDDILDNDPRGEFQQIGVGQAANLSSAFLSLGQNAILDSQMNEEVKFKTLQNFNEMILNVSYGQSLDLLTPQNEEMYWKIVEYKSGCFFGSALYMGALSGGAPHHVAQALQNVGQLYGEMIQIHDDLHDTMERPAGPDWNQKRSPLPILFARLVEHPDQDRFIELHQNIEREGFLEEAQEIIIRCGAVSYSIHQLLLKFEKSKEILVELPMKNMAVMQSLLDEVAAPVQRLLEEFV